MVNCKSKFFRLFNRLAILNHIKLVIKHPKPVKEVLHPRSFGKHPLRLPPHYMVPETYSEIFNMIEFLEIEILEELEV